jgi:septal ring factor EnvC (AmiA/AmiB activator)
MQDLSELRLDYERQTRLLDNLKKNYERRKKLNLLEPDYERQIVSDIKKIESEISSIARQIRSMQSANTRSKFMNDK